MLLYVYNMDWVICDCCMIVLVLYKFLLVGFLWEWFFKVVISNLWGLGGYLNEFNIFNII